MLLGGATQWLVIEACPVSHPSEYGLLQKVPKEFLQPKEPLSVTLGSLRNDHADGNDDATKQ